MERTITIPAQTLRQGIRRLEEYPPSAAGGPGSVSVTIGIMNDQGAWVESIPSQLVQIDGANYAQLVAVEPPAWAPDKPAGTYRNEDLWHFIDLLTADE